MEPATAPDAPFYPRPLLFTLIGAFVGLAAGSTAAWIRAVNDRSFRDDSEVEQQLGVEVLAAIPRLSYKELWRANGNRYVGFAGEKGQQFEAHRLLRSKIFYQQRTSGARTIAITSARPQEGKSTTAVNLALAMAVSGQRVVVLEADLRRPSLARYLDIESGPGLYDVLSGQTTIDLAIQSVDFEGLLPKASADFLREHGNLQDQSAVDPWEARFRVLPAGNPGVDASELLEGNGLGDVISTLREEAGYVLVDTPPVLAVHDFLSIVKHVECVVMAARLGKTSEDDARRALQLIARAKAPLMGIVALGVGAKSGYGYYAYQQPLEKSDSM